MIDYYMSVPTEADMPEIPEGASLDVIGTWFDYDPETETSTPRDGWHFNVRSVEPIEWPAIVAQYQPASPWRVWGGESLGRRRLWVGCCVPNRGRM